MDDKQIIIDGVDVSGCGHYEDLNCFAYRDSCGYPLDCKDNPSCYYKQLKQKEQECEELKKIIQRHDNDNNALLKEVEDRLCEYYRRYKQALAEIIRFFEEDEDFARYSGRPIIFAKSALEKIEKILKENDIKISEYKGKHNGKIGKTIT